MPGVFGNYADEESFPGTDYKWDFTVVPLDLTGCSALMTIKAFTSGADATFSVVCNTNDVGTTSEGLFSLDVPGTTTATWVPGTYLYYVVVTFSDGSTEILVGGIHMVKEFPTP